MVVVHRGIADLKITKLTTQPVACDVSYTAATRGNALPLSDVEAVAVGVLAPEVSRLLGEGWRAWPWPPIEIPGTDLAFATLQQFGEASDDELLAIPGIGPEEVAAIRRAALQDPGTSPNLLASSFQEARDSSYGHRWAPTDAPGHRPTVSPRALSLLTVLPPPEGAALRLDEVADAAGVGKSTATRALGELIAAGLAVRLPGYGRAGLAYAFRRAESSQP
jgi:hypothetical protein